MTTLDAPFQIATISSPEDGAIWLVASRIANMADCIVHIIQPKAFACVIARGVQRSIIKSGEWMSPTIRGYARTASSEPDIMDQTEALLAAGCTKIYQDECMSGRDLDRPSLRKVRADLMPGDTLMVCSVDRISRSSAALAMFAEELMGGDIKFKTVENSKIGKAFIPLMVTLNAMNARELEAEILAEQRMSIWQRVAHKIGTFLIRLWHSQQCHVHRRHHLEPGFREALPGHRPHDATPQPKERMDRTFGPGTGDRSNGAMGPRKGEAGHSLQRDGRFLERATPRYLLSGLLRCGECGGGFSKASAGRYCCSTHVNSKQCSNYLHIKQSVLEASVLSAVQDHFMNPEALTRFCEEYTRHVNSLRMERNARARHLQLELEKLDRDRHRLIEAIKAGVPGAEVKEDMQRIATRRGEVESLLSRSEEDPVLLHPSMARYYSESVTRLIVALNKDDGPSEARELLRSLIEKIVLTPNPGKTALQIDLYGDLAGILSAAERSANLSEPPLRAASVKLVGPEALQLNRDSLPDPTTDDLSRLSWWAQPGLNFTGTLGKVVTPRELELIKADIARILSVSDAPDPFNAYDITGKGYDDPQP